MQHISKYAHKAVYDISSAGVIADELGKLRAQIKQLKDAQATLEEILKSNGTGTATGKDYFVTITYGAQRKTVDWKTIAAKLEPSRQLVAAHTKTVTYDRVNVTAHHK